MRISVAAAFTGALLCAVALTAPRPALALDPGRATQVQGGESWKRAQQHRPGKAERRKDYLPNQYRSNRPGGEHAKPQGLRAPSGDWARPSRPAQERAPSRLYPSDEGDRRALQQLMRHDRARRAVEQGTIRPLEEIRDKVQRQFDGRIVGLELYENPNHGVPGYVYDVRVLTRKGDVMAVEMDARTGEVMSVRGKR